MDVGPGEEDPMVIPCPGTVMDGDTRLFFRQIRQVFLEDFDSARYKGVLSSDELQIVTDRLVELTLQGKVR